MEQNKDYNVTLTGAELNYIGQLLAARPYNEVFQIIPKIQTQVEAQIPPPVPEPPTES